MLPPCGHFLELYLPTSACSDSWPQERSCSGYCRNQFLTQLTFKKPIVTCKFSSEKKTQSSQGHDTLHPYLLQEECQSKQEVNSHRIEWPSYWQTINTRETLEMIEPSFIFHGNGHWQQPLEMTASTGQKENFNRAKPKISIPTPGPVLWKTIILNDPCTPTFTAVLFTITKTQIQEQVPQQIKY